MPNPPPFALSQVDQVVLRVQPLAAIQALDCGVRGCSLGLDGPPDAPPMPAAASLAAT